jgi:hypothetical protein
LMCTGGRIGGKPYDLLQCPVTPSFQGDLAKSAKLFPIRLWEVRCHVTSTLSPMLRCRSTRPKGAPDLECCL